jgi:hypothetical protein
MRRAFHDVTWSILPAGSFLVHYLRDKSNNVLSILG